MRPSRSKCNELFLFGSNIFSLPPTVCHEQVLIHNKNKSTVILGRIFSCVVITLSIFAPALKITQAKY